LLFSLRLRVCRRIVILGGVVTSQAFAIHVATTPAAD